MRIFIKRNILPILLVLTFVFTPLVPVEADTKEVDTTELKTLVTELRAMVHYLERLVGPQMGDSLTAAELRSVIEDSIDWIMTSQRNDGKFAYEYLPYEDEYTNDDNIVRQAGTLYSLTEVVRKDPSDRQELNAVIERSIDYLESLSAQDEYEGEEFRCVTKVLGSKACSLGATSLTLTAVLGYVEAYPDKVGEYDELIEAYKDFLLATKNPEAGFRQDYRLGEGFRNDKESPFYNGEALLALVRYVQYKEDSKVKAVIDDTFGYLKGKEYETPLYLWIMAALKDMQRLWPNDQYIEYGKDFTNYRMESLEWKHDTDRNYCAVVEGVASSYSLLEGEVTDSELTKIKRELDFWNIKNSFLQIRPEQTLRLVEEDKELALLPVHNIEIAKGGFLTAESELKQRIDFTQHCLSTYLQTLVDIEGKSLK